MFKSPRSRLRILLLPVALVALTSGLAIAKTIRWEDSAEFKVRDARDNPLFILRKKDGTVVFTIDTNGNINATGAPAGVGPGGVVIPAAPVVPGTTCVGLCSGGGTYAEFFAKMPGDNAATIAVGAAVLFPQTYTTAGGITRASSSQFRLPSAGVYDVSWQVSIDEAGQLVAGLDTGGGVVQLEHTRAGRATGTSQIANRVLIATTGTNGVLTIRNPTGNATALTVTPIAGGAGSVGATLVIKKL